MSEEEWLNKGLDKEVIPLVEFFNKNGLPTCMSCQGHNQTNMSMFWIQFDKSVTEDDILNFMKKHVGRHGSFCSNGRFAKRVIGTHCVPNGVWSKIESWNYFAATIEAANDDLHKWQTDEGTWKGIDGEDFQESRRIFAEKNL